MPIGKTLPVTFPDDPGQRYAAIADGFTELVSGTRDWNAPSPVAGWAARDVVWHLVDWLPGLLSSGASIELSQRDPTTSDPSTDWAVLDGDVRAMLSRPEIVSGPFAHPQAGTMTVGAAIDMLYTPDVFMHSWDLARATGQPIDLDADYCAGLLAGMEGIEEMLRSSGHYGTRVDVPGDADVQTRLIAFIGRDPNWSPG
jgi:uncharacterized protein (TIGR03086 family)